MNRPARPSRPRALATALGLVLCASAATPAAAAASAPSVAKARPPAAAQAPIDINSASRDQLKTLPGVGDAQARRIIAGRPYHSKADLAERDVIPTGVYVSLQGRIIATQKARGKVGVP